MKVVKYIEAAKIAGVTRQAIADMKKINSLHKGKYPFFVYDPENGKPGIDVKHPAWLNYLDKRKARGVKSSIKKQPSNGKEKALRKQLYDKDASIIQFVSICINAATEYFKASTEQMHEFKSLVATEYQKFKDGEK